MPLEFEKPILELERRIAELKETAKATGVDLEAEIRLLEERLARLRKETYENLTPWQRVQLARASGRPTTLDVLEKAFQDFIELHGDRAFADDPAIVGGLAYLEGRRWWWWGTRRAGTPRRTSSATSACPTPRGTARPCASWTWRTVSATPFSPSWTPPGPTPGSPPKSGARPGSSPRAFSG